MQIENALIHPDLPIRPRLVEDFAIFICNRFSILPDRITIASYELNNGINGMCIDESDNKFIILVNENERNITEVFDTIAHEMIHVKQYMKENLGWFLDNRSYIPYEYRWWEQEAFQTSGKIVEDFVRKMI
jgi:hypothetical protein